MLNQLFSIQNENLQNSKSSKQTTNDQERDNPINFFNKKTIPKQTIFNLD